MFEFGTFLFVALTYCICYLTYQRVEEIYEIMKETRDNEC